MKNLRMVLLLAIAVMSTLFAPDFEDYVKGVVDEDGNNLWHILAYGCDKPYFNDYIERLNAIDAIETEDNDMLLALLASQKNNKNQSPLDIAAANWAPHENKYCGDMIKMICAFQKMQFKGHRRKRISPLFVLFLEINRENKADSGD